MSDLQIKYNKNQFIKSDLKIRQQADKLEVVLYEIGGIIWCEFAWLICDAIIPSTCLATGPIPTGERVWLFGRHQDSLFSLVNSPSESCSVFIGEGRIRE